MSLKGKLDRWLATRLAPRTVLMRNQAPVVSFSFDDFPESAVTIGARILQDRGALGTFYMAGGLLGRVCEGVQIASREQVEQLWQAGHEIGCHTFSHVGVDRLGAEALNKELKANFSVFSEGHHDRRLSSFSFPFGLMSLSAKRYLARRFASCRSVVPGFHSGKIDLACLRAIRLYDTETDRARIDRCMDQLLRSNGWLIFYTHDVAERPSRYGCSPGLLEYAVDRADALGVDVRTVRNAVGRIAFGGLGRASAAEQLSKGNSNN